ncbi:MAG: hypothetical protein J7513_09795 [Solirubrobacteraceae bacterium]|nr:hypothetical protein [Solirubrobacteraceae bacterium]
MANTSDMPGGHLHAVVDAIATAGSQQLAKRAAEGAPVPFDLVETPSAGGAPMFSYKPRTRDFVEEHVDVLRQLAAWPSAVNVLAGFDGLGDYLLSHGERHVPIDPRDRADLVLRVLLASMHADTGDFLHTPGRTAAATAELARCVMGGREEATIIVPLLGVRLEAERLELEHGLALVRDDTIADLPRDARSPVRGRPGTLAVVDVLADEGGVSGLALARPRLRALLTALRLYDVAAPALAPVAWARVRGGGWASHPFIGTCARASGTLHLGASHHDAVRGFCDLVARAGRLTGPSTWALRRFELACERADHAEALTDTLLALRALLEADHLGSGLLGDRLAALCARPEHWDALRDRTQMAEAVEVALMQGSAVEPTQVRDVAVELRGHLRALLRDIACGHLPVDLASVADRHRSGVPQPPTVPPKPAADRVRVVEKPIVAEAVPAAQAPTVAPEPTPVAVAEPEPEASPEPIAIADGDDVDVELFEAFIDDEEHGPLEAVADWAAAAAGDAPDTDVSELTVEFDPFEGEDAVVDVLDARIEVDDEAQLTIDVPESNASADAPLADAADAPLAVAPPPPTFRPAQPAPGQIAAARMEARRVQVPSDREVLPSGERFEDAFVRSFTEGPGVIR